MTHGGREYDNDQSETREALCSSCALVQARVLTYKRTRWLEGVELAYEILPGRPFIHGFHSAKCP